MSGSPTRPRLRYVSVAELLARNIPPREFLVGPWLRQGESALLFAAPGTGKTMLTLTLAIAAAGGGAFLNWEAPKPRRVLYIDGEMNMADIRDRVRDLIPTVSGCDVAEVGRNLVLLARQEQHPDAEYPDLGSPEGQRAILQRARRDKVDLLVIDNLSTTFTSLEDENSAAAMRPAVGLLMRLKQAGVACILVHHTNKSGDGYRGSSMLATTFEAIIGLHKGPDMKDDKGPAFEMNFQKFRGKRHDDVTMPRAVFLMEGAEGLAWRQEKAARQEVLDLVAAVESGEFASQADLAKHFNVSQPTITRLKASAIHKHGLLTAAAWDAHMGAAKEVEQEAEF